MYYLIWMCVQCSMSAPLNLGLYDTATACEYAKEQVSNISDRPRHKNFLKCIPKGAIK